jgi:hypothetical protein
VFKAAARRARSAKLAGAPSKKPASSQKRQKAEGALPAMRETSTAEQTLVVQQYLQRLDRLQVRRRQGRLGLPPLVLACSKCFHLLFAAKGLRLAPIALRSCSSTVPIALLHAFARLAVLLVNVRSSLPFFFILHLEPCSSSRKLVFCAHPGRSRPTSFTGPLAATVSALPFPWPSARQAGVFFSPPGLLHCLISHLSCSAGLLPPACRSRAPLPVLHFPP